MFAHFGALDALSSERTTRPLARVEITRHFHESQDGEAAHAAPIDRLISKWNARRVY